MCPKRGVRHLQKSCTSITIEIRKSEITFAFGNHKLLSNSYTIKILNTSLNPKIFNEIPTLIMSTCRFFLCVAEIWVILISCFYLFIASKHLTKCFIPLMSSMALGHFTAGVHKPACMIIKTEDCCSTIFRSVKFL